MPVERVDIGPLIRAARAAHLEGNPDIVHALDHHQSVVKNCHQIIEIEDLRDVELDILLVAASWHDFKRDGENSLEEIRFRLGEVGADPEFVERVIGVIGEHSFGTEQTSLESQVLWMADKLEYVSVERLEVLLGSGDERLIGKYAQLWNSRILGVVGRFKDLGFQRTQDLFGERLKCFLDFAQTREAPFSNKVLSQV